MEFIISTQNDDRHRRDRFLLLRRANMPHRIFEIDELARLISCHLVSTHPASAVSLASTCRFLEEPALSSLWELQDSLTALIGVSPIIMIDGEVCDRGSLSYSHLTPPSGNGVRHLWKCVAQVSNMCHLDASTAPERRRRPLDESRYLRSPSGGFDKRTRVSKTVFTQLLLDKSQPTVHPPLPFPSPNQILHRRPAVLPQSPERLTPRSHAYPSSPTDFLPPKSDHRSQPKRNRSSRG